MHISIFQDHLTKGFLISMVVSISTSMSRSGKTTIQGLKQTDERSLFALYNFVLSMPHMSRSSVVNEFLHSSIVNEIAQLRLYQLLYESMTDLIRICIPLHIVRYMMRMG